MNNPLDRQRILYIFVTVFICALTAGSLFLNKIYTHEQWQSTQINNLNEQIKNLTDQLSNSSKQLTNLEQKEIILSEKLASILSFYQKLEMGFDVNILIVGDSIGAQEWPNLLVSDLENMYGISIKLTNISMGGNSSYYAGYARLMALDYEAADQAADYDLVIFCYGQNDGISDFGQHYEGMIRAARFKYPGASMISILESSQKGYTEKIQIIQELAEHYEILIADTIEPFMTGDYGAYDQLTDDGIHPNAAGQEIYKNVIAEVIHQAVKAGLGHSRWNNSPVHDNIEKFDHFAWFKADEFQREGNTFTLKLKEIITGTLAIYSYRVPGENAYQIYVDNTEIFNHEFDWPYGFCQAYIVEIADNCTVNSAVRISFETETQADGFQGICFNWE